jgi:predicted hotdog family 3-hydroxylacyl-ACP dehydratase
MEPIAEPLEKLIPHRGKMSLLSRVLSYDMNENSLLAEVDILQSSFFYDDSLKGVPVWVGFEYMAQSIAALSGKSDLAKGLIPGFGFILSVSNFIANVPCFELNSTILIYVKEVLVLDNMFLFDCSIKHGSAELAKATMSTVKIRDVSEVKNEE